MLLFLNGLIHKLKKIGEGSLHFSCYFSAFLASGYILW